ncbi:hypothetical protein PMIN01_13533 [Paraphaeosphaeria minitans]|uniref:Uncharacterized protein n=1 Tax=Paraphaeosphaeria minitans TaxID=565426 RepID=A0A9P6G4R1_9PLEO|nr:hypothetical protein PMIN01_13533 [Paraphaeosphaeria minitans]
MRLYQRLTFKQLGCDECEIQPGPSVESTGKNEPPPNTLAVIVEISHKEGSLKVYKASNNPWGNEFVEKVAPEDSDDGEKLVIAR